MIDPITSPNQKVMTRIESILRQLAEMRRLERSLAALRQFPEGHPADNSPPQSRNSKKMNRKDHKDHKVVD